jgi:tight adherence protein C
MTTIAVALGAAGGFGVWLLWTGWHPAVEPLSVVVARFGRPGLRGDRMSSRDLDAWFGTQVRRIGRVERTLERLRADLAIMERSPDDVAASIGACALLGLFAGPIVLIPRLLVGFPVPVVLAGWVALVAGVAGALYPVLELRGQAARRRRAFQQVLSAYCVSVDMCLQVGSGPEEALIAAADGHGWQFGRLRSVLTKARVRNEEPWVALRRLGEEIEVPDLVELAKTIEQVAVKGAAVGEAVAGIADSIQARIAASIETQATRNTVRMAIPTTMLLFGFMVLMAWPAARAVLGAFG